MHDLCLLGGVPCVKIADDNEGAPTKERVRVAGRDDGLGASLRGVVGLGGPVITELLDATGLAFLVVAEQQVNSHEAILAKARPSGLASRRFPRRTRFYHVRQLCVGGVGLEP